MLAAAVPPAALVIPATIPTIAAVVNAAIIHLLYIRGFVNPEQKWWPTLFQSPPY
jgi:hypothetical protein